MIDGIGSSFTGLARSASYNAAQPARVNQQESTSFSVEHAVPKDSITITSDLSANPVAASSSSEKSKNENGQLSDGEQEQVQELKTRDTEVRAHEQAHAAAGGAYAGAPSYTETRGPDGHSYAIGGEVSIDSAPISGDPEASIAKLNTVIAAALAPAQPSGQDQAVAAQAQTNLAQAYTELREKNLGGSEEEQEASEVSGLQSLLQVQEYPETASDPSALLLNATQAYQAAAV
ncbi:putative metalloprotease CJM1_0395 family protein [Pseudovibrio ascidiaceicola]|uniref:putative metalloprotease CJM1_0395 family protein n=1 Tax=Pseudovibrio ascidiaceicola TaxID=285279 RepID=UPI003D363AA6